MQSMWHTAFVVATGALLLGSSQGQVLDDLDDYQVPQLDDLDEDQLQDNDNLMEEAELYELEHEEHRHHHGHHRPRRFLGLLGHHAAPPELLAGRDPAVAKKLQHMEMQDFRSREASAKHAHSHLEGEVNEAIHHMNSVTGIKSALAKTEVKIRYESRKLRRLEDDILHLDKTHKSLSSSLHRIMGPKIQYAEQRLEKERHQVHELEKKENAWKGKEEKLHHEALAMLEKRHESKAELEEAVEAEAKAHRERLEAEKTYVSVKRDTTAKVQGYKYAKTQASASLGKEERGKEEEKEDEASLQRLNRIFDAEQRRVDDSMNVGKDKVKQKIFQVKEEKKESESTLATLEHEYGEWQGQQADWDTRLAASRDSTDLASKDLVDSQEAMLASARNQVIQDAEADSDWEAWDQSEAAAAAAAAAA